MQNEANEATQKDTNCATICNPMSFRQRIERERDWAIKTLTACQRKLDLFDSLSPQAQDKFEEIISI